MQTHGVHSAVQEIFPLGFGGDQKQSKKIMKIGLTKSSGGHKHNTT